MSYCKVAPGHPFHGPYHDREYGFPIRKDAALLERLALEINQAGLSWLTMLKKRDGFRRAFAYPELSGVPTRGGPASAVDGK
jgi:DNA-3-methyladenine glycosylase I